jgi:aspartate racemase
MAATAELRGRDGAIGIVGGMGPLASAEFFKKLSLAALARGDAGLIRIVVDSDPAIPDRSDHILGTGPDPLPAMLASVKRLEGAGVRLCTLASISAHAYLDGLMKGSSCAFASAFEALGAYIQAKHAGVKRIGVLATSGTIKAGLFDRLLPELRVHYSDDEAQERFVNEAVFGKAGVKTGNLGEEPRHLLKQAAARLVARGSDLVIVACAEMSLVLAQADVSVPLLDPMQILADDLASRFRS